MTAGKSHKRLRQSQSGFWDWQKILAIDIAFLIPKMKMVRLWIGKFP
jgi:hypothetical protein